MARLLSIKLRFLTDVLSNYSSSINEMHVFYLLDIDYRLAIICSKEDDKQCYVIENLHAYMRTSPDVQLKHYLTDKYMYCNPNYKQLGVPPLASDRAGWKVDVQQ